MIIERRSHVSGIVRSMDLPIQPEQLEAWRMGQHAQKAFPNLTPAQREFIMTGCTEAEWDSMFAGHIEEDQIGI